METRSASREGLSPSFFGKLQGFVFGAFRPLLDRRNRRLGPFPRTPPGGNSRERSKAGKKNSSVAATSIGAHPQLRQKPFPPIISIYPNSRGRGVGKGGEQVYRGRRRRKNFDSHPRSKLSPKRRGVPSSSSSAPTTYIASSVHPPPSKQPKGRISPGPRAPQLFPPPPPSSEAKKKCGGGSRKRRREIFFDVRFRQTRSEEGEKKRAGRRL